MISIKHIVKNDDGFHYSDRNIFRLRKYWFPYMLFLDLDLFTLTF